MSPAPFAGVARRWVLCAGVLAATAASASPPSVATCTREPDDARRLACYDALFRGPATVPDEARAAPVPAAASTAAPEAAARGGQAASIMSRTWELEPADKRGTFTVRTYLPNFFLPLHYTNTINTTPASPSHSPAAPMSGYRDIEAKVQISLRAKIAQNLFLPNADLWFAYTQRSLWQLWDGADSSPFRSTDYQPEAIYVVPVPAKMAELPGGWRARMLQLGLGHQSNGQSDPLSRSWNRIFAGVGLERGELGVVLRAYRRVQEQGGDDNPDLLRYTGRAETAIQWSPATTTVGLTWRTNFNSLHRGSLQLDITHPVVPGDTDGLRWYAQIYSGYGETLLDYNHRQTRYGVGLSLFQF